MEIVRVTRKIMYTKHNQLHLDEKRPNAAWREWEQDEESC